MIGIVSNSSGKQKNTWVMINFCFKTANIKEQLAIVGSVPSAWHMFNDHNARRAIITQAL